MPAGFCVQSVDNSHSGLRIGRRLRMFRPGIRIARSITLAVLSAVSTATTCSATQGIAVAIGPAFTLDSAASAGFSVTERIAVRHGMASSDSLAPNNRCFFRNSFSLCGKVKDRELQFRMIQSGTTQIWGFADTVRTELLDSLRSEFGIAQVRQCEWRIGYRRENRTLQRSEELSGCAPSGSK